MPVFFENLPWEIDHLQILHQTVMAGIPLSNEFSEVIEAVELCFKNLKKTHEIQPTKSTMNVRKND